MKFLKFSKVKIVLLVLMGVIFIGCNFNLDIAIKKDDEILENNIKKIELPKSKSDKEHITTNTIPANLNSTYTIDELTFTVEGFNNPAQDDPYPDFRFNSEDLSKFFSSGREELELDISDTVPLRLIDNQKQNAESIKWYFFQKYPYKTMLTKEETHSLESAVIINDGEIVAKKEGYGNILAVYNHEGKAYIHRMNVEVKDKKEEKRKHEELSKKTNQIIKDVMSLSDFEKVKYVHDYLANNIGYDDNYLIKSDPYYVLVEGRAVCGGYANAFQYLTKELGVKSERVLGDALLYTGNWEYHAWNRVKIENGWYYVDVTWDDRAPMRYNYFLLDEENIQYDHRIYDDLYYEKGNKYNLYPYMENVDFAVEREELEKVIKNMVDVAQDKRLIRLLAPKSMTVADIENIFKKYVKSNMTVVPLREEDYRNYKEHIFRVYFSEDYLSKIDPVKFLLSLEEPGSVTTENIIISLDKSVDLGLHNIYIQNATKEHLTYIGNNTYRLKISDVRQNNEVKIKLVKAGYKFPTYFVGIKPNIVKADIPNVDFIGVGYKSGKFVNSKYGYMYNTGDGEWKNIEEGKEIDINIGSFILVKNVEQGKVDSDFQKIVFREQAIPDWLQVNGNIVSGINSKMEYKDSNTNVWKSITANTLKLESGDYEFRFKGKRNVLGSNIYKLTVE